MREYFRQLIDRKGWVKGLGIHHIPLSIVWVFLFGPIGNMMFWMGKEWANARQKALKDTNYQATIFDTFKPKYWEYPDLITPSILGWPIMWVISFF